METANETSSNAPTPWGARVPVEIDKESGLMIAGEAKRPIDVSQDVSLALSSYLSMVYELRSMTSGIVSLRVEDISSLANAFEMEETEIGERLARLMHCDDLQTRRFLQMVKRGRVLVPVSMVAAGALIAVTLSFASPTATPNSAVKTGTRAAVEIVEPTTMVRTQDVVTDIGDAASVQRSVVTNASADPTNDVTASPDVEVLGESIQASDIQIGTATSVTRGDGMGE